MTQSKRIGRYDLRQEIGRGMMGVVYEAYDPVLERTIALKVISLSYAIPAAERAAFEERFTNEAKIAARLAHPGIIVAHDVGRDSESGALYITLEFLRGQTLQDLTSHGKHLEWRRALGLVRGVAEALHHAHLQGVIHRDIKPANVMVLGSGETKIMDFGIAKVAAAQASLTSPGEFFGTPLYMAPEQALGHPADARTDIFSLGSVAYTLVTGRPAFAAESVPRVLVRVAHEREIPCSQVVPEVPGEVDAILSRAMAKNPEERYPTAQALAEAIGELLSGHPPPPPATETPTPRAGRSASHVPETMELALPGSALRAPRERLELAAALGLVAVLLALASRYFVVPPAPRFGPPLVTMARVPTPAPLSPEEDEAAPATPGTPSGTMPVPESAHLAVDVEHSLKEATLKVFLDRNLVLTEPLVAKVTRKVALLFPVRKGGLARVLDLPPGVHRIRVQVVWAEGNEFEEIASDFRRGMTRRLQVRVGSVQGELKLDWGA